MFSLLERAKNKKLAVAFGKREWERYFGPVGKEPPLPVNILEILESPCPIWGERDPEKKVIDTHLLTLIPQKVNGKVLTLNYLGELIPHPKSGGHKVEYDSRTYDDSMVFYELGDLPSGFANGASHWVLMTKDVVPQTRESCFGREWEAVESLSERSERLKVADYQPPKALDAAVCILMEYVRRGNMLYREEAVMDSIHGTYTFCGDAIYGGSAIIGGFQHFRIRIYDSRDPGCSDGLALMRLL